MAPLPSSFGNLSNAPPISSHWGGSFGNISLSSQPRILSDASGLGLLVFRVITTWKLDGVGNRRRAEDSPPVLEPQLVSETVGLLLQDADIRAAPPLQVPELGAATGRRCPDHDPYCIHITFDITLPHGSELGDFGIFGRKIGYLGCWLWSFGAWERTQSSCTVSDTRLNDPAHGYVRCSCDRDGLVVVAFVPHVSEYGFNATQLMSLRMANVVRVARCHLLPEIALAITLGVLLALLVVLVFVLQRRRMAGGKHVTFVWAKLPIEDLTETLENISTRSGTIRTVDTVGTLCVRNSVEAQFGSLSTKEKKSLPEDIQNRGRDESHSQLLAGGAMQLAEGHWNWFESPIIHTGWNRMFYPRLRFSESESNHRWFTQIPRWLYGIREGETVFGVPYRLRRLSAQYDTERERPRQGSHVRMGRMRGIHSPQPSIRRQGKSNSIKNSSSGNSGPNEETETRVTVDGYFVQVKGTLGFPAEEEPTSDSTMLVLEELPCARSPAPSTPSPPGSVAAQLRERLDRTRSPAPSAASPPRVVAAQLRRAPRDPSVSSAAPVTTIHGIEHESFWDRCLRQREKWWMEESTVEDAAPGRVVVAHAQSAGANTHDELDTTATNVANAQAPNAIVTLQDPRSDTMNASTDEIVLEESSSPSVVNVRLHASKISDSISFSPNLEDAALSSAVHPPSSPLQHQNREDEEKVSWEECPHEYETSHLRHTRTV